MPVLDPIADIRSQLESAAQRADLSPRERRAKLRRLREGLVTLLSTAETYLGDVESEEDALDLDSDELAVRMRENADVRAVLLERELATAEELDSMGYFSHEALDTLAEQGKLQEAALSFAEKLHPRDRSGRWKDKLGLVKNLQVPGAPSEPLGKDSPGTQPRPTRAQAKARQEMAAQRERREARRGTKPAATGEEARRQVARAAAKKATPKTPDEKKTEAYEKRAEALKGRVESVATEGRHLTDAEAHFNDAGKVSQRTLLRYVRDATTQPTTIDQFSSVDDEGNRVWDSSRKELHDRIIDTFLRQRVWDDGANGKGGWVMSETAPQLVGVEEPKVLFSGGGYAAGKGGVIKILAAQGETPESGYEGPTLVLDPDQVKAMLPEFQALLGTDPEANLLVYEEAWEIAQEIQAQAQEKKLNLVVDGISNTSPDEMVERARSFIDRGYSVRAVYVDIPTEEALKRAANRAKNAKDESDRRHIPEIIMRSVHRDVAATVPNLARHELVTNPDTPFDLEVWDNDQGQDETGAFRPPKRFYAVTGGQELIDDETLWGRFQTKGHEEILGVDRPIVGATGGGYVAKPSEEKKPSA